MANERVAAYGNDLIARGLKVYVGINAQPEMIPVLLEGRATARQILSLLEMHDGRVGVWWGIMGQFGDIEDFEDYAWVDEPLTDTHEDLEGGEVSIVLIAKRPRRNGEPWDPEHHNPPNALMGNSFLDDRESVELVEIRYNAGNGWKSLPARGLRVTADATKTASPADIISDEVRQQLLGDPDTKRLYSVEAQLKARLFDFPQMSIAELQALADKIGPKIGVMPIGQAGVAGTGNFNGKPAFIGVGPDMRDEATLIHEMTHVQRGTKGLVSPGAPDHGPDFLKHYLRLLRKYCSNPDYAKMLSGNMGGRYAAKTAMPMNLPEGIEFEYIPDRGSEGRGVIGPGALLLAKVDGEEIGGLAWYTSFVAGPMGHQRGQIEAIYVKDDWQRRGIATEMLRRAREIEPRVHHSKSLTEDGRAWSERVAGPMDDYIPMRFRAPRPPTYDQLDDPRQVVFDRPALEDMEDLPGDIRNALKRSLEDLQQGRAELDAKERELRGVYTLRLTPKWRAAVYLGADGNWHCFYVGPHTYDEVTKRWTHTATKTALPSWRDRGTMPERAEAIIAPDVGRGRRNSYEVFLYGQPHTRRPSLAEAKAVVEEIYGDLDWVKVPGDPDPHPDRIWGDTTMFNDAPYYLVVDRLPRLGTTAFKNWRGEDRDDIKPNPDGTITLYRTESRMNADWDHPGPVGVHWTTWPWDYGYNVYEGDRVMWCCHAKPADVLSVADKFGESEVVLKPGARVTLVGRTVRKGRALIPKGIHGGETPMRAVVPVEGRPILPEDHRTPGHDPTPPEGWPGVTGSKALAGLHDDPIQYTVRVEFGRRRPDAQPTEGGPVSPAYLDIHAGERYVTVWARSAQEARLIATEMVAAGEDSAQNPVGRTGDMPTSAEVIRAEAAIVATAADLDHWRPTGGMFARGKDTLDPRVFDTATETMLPVIRASVIDTLDAFWTPKYGDWRAWAKVYLAGSGASFWWDSDADMDILIGVDLDRLREDRPANREVADADILGHLNASLKELGATTTTMNGFVTTWFVNADSYDIRRTHPYAAYDVTADEWVVKPPVLPANWGPESIPEETWRRCEMAARSAHQVLSLPEPERTVAGTVYFDWVKAGRKASYSAHGGGWLDAGNVIYQYLAQHPERLLRRLYLCKHPEQAEEADAIEVTAAAVPGLVIEEEWDLPSIDPNQRAVAARVNGKLVGGLIWNTSDGIIDYVQVDADMRRKGIGTALLEAARGLDPNVRHDDESRRSELGKEWVRAVGAKHTVTTGDYAGISFDYERKHRGRNGQEYLLIREPTSYVARTPDGRQAGYLTVVVSTNEIGAVNVVPKHQRQGIATALLEMAREDYPGLAHTSVPGQLSPKGEAWARTVGSRTAQMNIREVYSRTDRIRDHVKKISNAEATALLRRVLTDHGFPQGEEAYTDTSPMRSSSLIGWDLDTTPPIPIVFLHPRMMSDLVLLHEAAHLLWIGRFPGRDHGFSNEQVHDQRWMALWKGLIDKYAAWSTQYEFDRTFGYVEDPEWEKNAPLVMRADKRTIDMTPEMPDGWKGNGIYEMDISRFSTTGCVALLADVSGMVWPIGWLTWDRERFTIEGIYVNPDYRGKGIGVELMKEAEKVAGRSLKNDSGEYTPEGLAWAKRRGIDAHNEHPVSTSDMARMQGQMNNLLIGGDLIKRQLQKVGAKTGSGGIRATANLAYYAREWRWQAWAENNGHGHLTRNRPLPALRKAAQDVLADYGITAPLDIQMAPAGTGYSEGGLIDGKAHVRINPEEKNLWNALHEAAHVVCDHKGMDSFDSDHGPGFQQVFTEVLAVHGGIDVDMSSNPGRTATSAWGDHFKGGTIYRGLRVTLPPDVDAKVRDLLAMETDPESYAKWKPHGGKKVQAGELIVRALEKSHWDSEMGLGRHWSERRDMAETAAQQGGRGDWAIVLTATYTLDDVDRDWLNAGSPTMRESEAEVTLKPGAQIEITQVDILNVHGFFQSKGERVSYKPIRATAAWSPYQPPAHIKVTSDGDAVPGGYNGYFVAWEASTGKKMGYLDYQSGKYNGTEFVTIAMVEVDPEFRRQGVATVLLDALRNDFPDAEIEAGYTTPEGSAWWSKVGKALEGKPDKIAAMSPAKMWHVTTSRDFKPDPTFKPGGGNGEVGVFGEGLFLTPNPELWAYLWAVKEYGSLRSVYAAEIDVSGVPSGDFYPVGMPDRDQYWVEGQSVEKVKVKRTIPIQQAIAESNRAGYGLALLALDAVERGRLCVIDHKAGWGEPTALCERITNGDPLKWTTIEDAKTGPLSSRICEDCAVELQRRK